VPAYICGTPETNDIIKSLVTPSRARIIFGEPLDLSDISRHRSGDKAALAEVTERFKLALTTLQARALADQQSIDY
jgi:1-acyl-sn-glycerol-3-phosphate acyltransferase